MVGQDWPRVDAGRRVYFRMRAPEVQKIRVLGTDLVKGEDGFFTGVTAPQDPGFHYYQLTVDGLAVADPNSESFFGSGNVRSGIEIPEAGVKHTYFEAPGTAHEFQTWRKSLYGFAPLLFRK